MNERFPFRTRLPEQARPALAIVRKLVAAGYQALLAGGCVRDLLLGQTPHDYDVATNAPPTEVGQLFCPTRQVGAQFGVALVKKHGRWVEVATFRADGPYLNGRRPVRVTLSDARHDALRRDFTVNGMFLDPLSMEIVDYVGGMADLKARLIRAIGDPAARFDEDYLRLLRAVRFAAQLGFEIEPATLAAVKTHAPTLAKVAPERVREELERMFTHPSRCRAWSLLGDCGLRPYLWPGAAWTPEQVQTIDRLLPELPPEAGFELVMAILLSHTGPDEIERIARALTLSNEQRQTTAWLVAHQADLDDPGSLSLAALKLLMANPAFRALVMLARARHQRLPDAGRRQAVLEKRVAGIPPGAVQPPPLVTGEDLLRRGVPPGPIYKDVLEQLYRQQLDEQVRSREQALAELERLLSGLALPRQKPGPPG